MNGCYGIAVTATIRRFYRFFSLSATIVQVFVDHRRCPRLDAISAAAAGSDVERR